MWHSVEMEIEIILLLFDMVPSFLTLLCSFLVYTCHWAQRACFDSLVNDTWGLFWSQNNVYLWNSRSNRKKKCPNLFGGRTLDWVVLCLRRQPFGLVCWSVMVCFSLVLSNHNLVFTVLPIAVYIILWLEKMKHCIYFPSSKREDMVEKRRPQPLEEHVLGRHLPWAGKL